jgi:predicted AlkP superfamily phosphohydrolase/phosphomutase
MFFGYIDPGTGYTISTWGLGLISFLAGLLGFLFFYFKKIFRFFWNRRRFWFLLVLMVAVVCVIIYFLMNSKNNPSGRRVIVLGFDGLDPKLVEELMERGRLPNFLKLKTLGDYRHLTTTNPAQSPVAWATFATGKNPAATGIFDFVVREPRSYQLSLSLSSVRGEKAHPVVKCPGFWRYLTVAKIPAVVLACPLTFPPDRLRGRMLSGMGVPDVLGTEGTFTFYTTENIGEQKDTGGNVFQIPLAPVMVLNLIGPKRRNFLGRTENVRQPFKVEVAGEKNGVSIKFQKNKLWLEVGHWSDWQRVTFDVGPFKKLKGIFKFYLVSCQPHFRLYISPINFDPQAPFFPISFPVGYSAEIARQIGLFHTAGQPIDTWAINEKRLSDENLLEEAVEEFKEKQALFDWELSRLKKGLLFGYFSSLDTVQHMFWRFIDPASPLYSKNSPEKFKEVIENWYQRLDFFLAGVISRLGPEDILMVLSDHGFGPFRRAVQVNSWLRDNGYLQLKNPEQKDGRPLLADVDWPRTRAYAIGFSSIYLNLKNREGQGVVTPEEAAPLKKELIKKLEKWNDGKLGLVVHRVYQNEEIFSGHYVFCAPDLVIGFNPGYRASWQTALGAAPSQIIENNLKKWSGDHIFAPELVPGVLFVNRKIQADSVSIYDLAPTILKLAGISEARMKKAGFEGKLIL